MTDHRRLLGEYAANRSEEAFRAIVAAYIDLVYGTAVRLLHGDTHHAEDVAQVVFIDLARRAGTLSPAVLLGGWLHRRTCHAVATFLRGERRRHYRERQAAEMKSIEDHSDHELAQLAPVLDEAINQMSVADRSAIVLRYFEGLDLRAVGEALGTNEDAAQKRVARALDKLRVLLIRRGVTASGAVLVSALSAQATSLAPAGLAASVSTAALASAATGAGLTAGLLNIIAMTKVQIAAGAVLLAGFGTILIIDHQANANLRAENRELQQRLADIHLRDETASADAVASNAQVVVVPDAAREIERLQQELALLQKQTGALEKLQLENQRLRTLAWAGALQGPAEVEFKQETEKRVHDLKRWALIFRMHANDKPDGIFPQDWSEIAHRVPPAEAETFRFATNHFEIMYHGNRNSMTNAGQSILLREREPRQSPGGQWIRVYALGDGSAQTLGSVDGNFEAVEKRLTGRP